MAERMLCKHEVIGSSPIISKVPFLKKYIFMTYQLILSLKSFEPKLIENYLKNVQSLAHKLKNEQLVGRSVSSLRNTGASPTKIRKITVLSSPHIDKKAREQFEMRVFQKHLRVDTFSTFLEFFLFVDLFKAIASVGVQSKLKFQTRTKL